MRPTRLGRVSPDRPGLVYVGIGVDPGLPTTDPAPPTDRAATGVAYVPYLNAGEAGVAQWKAGQGVGGDTDVTITLDDAPTVGNMLVAFVGCDDDGGPTYGLSNGTWTQVGTTVFAGNGTNWPLRMFRQTVDVTTSQTTLIDSGGGSTDTGTVKAVIVELSGVDVVDADIGSATNTATTTDSITPTSSLPAVILSGVFARNGSAPALTAAGGMSELVEQGASRPLAVNQQTIASTTGSYTVGSTGASANSAMIAATFEDTGDSTIWLSAPLTIDENDATFEPVLETSIDAAGDAFWRCVLPDTFLIASISVRLGMEDAGANTITVQAGNLSDYSDVVTIATIPFTATGSYTAQDVIDSWTATTVYRYWQLLITTSSGITLFEVELFDAETEAGVTVHDDLSGRDLADQHPADAVSYDNTASGLTADDVQAALDELDGLVGSGGVTGTALGGVALNTANTTVTTGATTTLDITTEEYDPDAWHFTATTAITGTVTKTASSQTLTGSGTSFTTELSVGQVLSIPGTATEIVAVKSIESTTSLTLWAAPANTAGGQTATRKSEYFVVPAAATGTYLCSLIGQFGLEATPTHSTLVQFAQQTNSTTVTGVWNAVATPNANSNGVMAAMVRRRTLTAGEIYLFRGVNNNTSSVDCQGFFTATRLEGNVPVGLSTPTVVAVGTSASGTGDVTPGLPTGHALNDILLLFVQSDNQAATAPAGYAKLGPFLGIGTAAAAGATRLTVFWKRDGGSEAAPTVTDTGDHTLAQIMAVRGCPTIGDPFLNVGVVRKPTASTTGTAAAGATPVDACLVVDAFVHALDSASAVFSAPTNADLTSVTEQIDVATADGNGGGIGVVTGTKATTGSFTGTTVTMTSGIDLAATFLMLPAGITTRAGFIDRQVFLTPGVDDTWTRPTAAKRLDITAIAGGGGGSSGRNAATAAGGGGGGGGGFGHNNNFDAGLLPTATVTVGVGGAATANTDGASGNSGTLSRVTSATFTIAFGGAPAGGGASASGSGGTGGGGGGLGGNILGAGVDGAGSVPPGGGTGGTTAGGGGRGVDFAGGAGAGGGTTQATSAGGYAVRGGGGGGGGRSNTNVGTGGLGGLSFAGGATAGAVGTDSTMAELGGGGGAGGTSAAGPGGTGGWPGGGGGGGGTQSGAQRGGAGGDGAVVIVTRC